MNTKKQKNNSLAAALTGDQNLQLEWEGADRRLGSATRLLQERIYTRFTEQPDRWLLHLGFADATVPLSPSLDFWRRLTALFIQRLRLTPDIEELREKAVIAEDTVETARLLENAPVMVGGEHLSPALLSRFWAELNRTFGAAISEFDGSISDFIHKYAPAAHLLGRIYFHLVENRDDDLPFAFLATYSSSMGGDGTTRHLPLKYALQEYRDDRDKLLELLTTVYLAARGSELLSELLESNDLFLPLAWSSEQAYTFLREVELYEEAGILCRIPDWWKSRKAGVTVRISLGEQQPAMLGLSALLDFTPRLVVDGEEITADEARRLLARVEGLAFIKNRWIEVDHRKLSQALAAYEQAKKLAGRGLSLAEAMRLQLGSNRELLKGVDEDILEVEHGRWLRDLFDRTTDQARLEQIPKTRGFRAELRPYQESGLHWLHGLHGLGFGACLADDMGLGKTVQILAFLSSLPPEERSGPSLLVLPASLLANWQEEIDRFAPGLRVFFAHPSMHRSHRVTPPGPEKLAETDLVITTYGLVNRYDWLRQTDWHYVIIDEAQAIKNPRTRQTRAIKALSSRNRIALTGTPVENRLSDFWSLFDFINSGLLGTAAEFSRFSKKLKQHPEGYRRLRRMTAPFLLRRLKSDKSIINDLPDKVELKSWAELSREQTVLYQQLVNEISDVLEDKTDGIRRRGMILAALTKFKQVCNHPDQYTGAGGFAEKESGKFTRLREICATIHERREQVLVFTQFKEMTGPLARFLEELFGRAGLVLHGGVAVGKRKKIIEEFQTAPYTPFMVLSLKAGGVGLNLTRANHVIHFDRWWNPAVENQATDRAFRIGQDKKVMVHKFITRGTIEEKIDRMLAAKEQLARDVVSESGEKWLTEMSNDELRELFTLK